MAKEMTPVDIIPDAIDQLRDHVSAVCDRDTTTTVSAFGQYEDSEHETLKKLWIAYSVDDHRLRHLNRGTVISVHPTGGHVQTADFLRCDALEQAQILIHTFNDVCERYREHIDMTVEAF